MKYIPSTYEIMAFRSLNRDVDARWVQWAVDMMMSGYETERVIFLAGESAPYLQFPMQELFDNAIKELSLDHLTQEEIIKGYAFYLTGEALRGSRDTFEVLKILYDVYFEIDEKFDLYDFYLLYYAKKDIMEYGDQHYWPDADRNNIDAIITDQFERWRDEYLPA